MGYYSLSWEAIGTDQNTYSTVRTSASLYCSPNTQAQTLSLLCPRCKKPTHSHSSRARLVTWAFVTVVSDWGSWGLPEVILTNPTAHVGSLEPAVQDHGQGHWLFKHWRELSFWGYKQSHCFFSLRSSFKWITLMKFAATAKAGLLGNTT